jgi:tetratricopeptide (TPR) repeat protein
VFQLAETQFANGDMLNAIDNFQLVITEDPNFTTARDRINQATEGFRTSILAESAYFASTGNYAQAMSVLNNAMGILGNDAELVVQIETYRQMEVLAGIAEAESLAAAGEYLNALNMLRVLDGRTPGNTEVARAVSVIENDYINYIVERASEYAAEQRYSDAVMVLEQGLRESADNVLLTSTRDEYLSADIGLLISHADGLAAEGMLNEAIDILRDSVHSNNVSVRDKISEIESLFPVFLNDMTTLSLARSDNRSNIYAWNRPGTNSPRERDNTESLHANGLGVSLNFSWERNSWILAEYFIDQEFALLEGTYVLNFDTRNVTGAYTLRIYLDNAHVYTSPVMTAGRLPIDFSIDVSGASTIGFYFEGVYGRNVSNHTPRLALVNTAFYREGTPRSPVVATTNIANVGTQTSGTGGEEPAAQTPPATPTPAPTPPPIQSEGQHRPVHPGTSDDIMGDVVLPGQSG